MTESSLVLAGQAITDCCKKIIPGQSEEYLLSKLQSLIPEHTIRHAFSGDEWYRLGGVVDMDGNRIANDLIEWVERTYLECGQNLQTLIEHAVDKRLIATKQTGRTLYFVVQTGERAEDFTLIEVDKTREVSDRLLVDEQLPVVKADFAGKAAMRRIVAREVGHAFQIRRLIDGHHLKRSPRRRQVVQRPQKTTPDPAITVDGKA